MYLYGVPAATITRVGERLQLRYLPDYVAAPNPTPISVSLPVVAGSFPSADTRKFLENLLPDRADVRSRWAREAKLTSDSAFDLLSVYGADVAGALEFYPAGSLPRQESNLTPLSDVEIGDRIREIRKDDSQWRPQRVAEEGFSLGGAQGKFALTLDDGLWFEASGSQPSTHIFKPGIHTHVGSDITEYITINIARAFGIEVPAVTIGEFDGEHVLIVERFDRLENGGHITRVHQEDLAQALSVSHVNKYESDGGPSYSDFFELFDRVLAVAQARQAKQRFAELLVFSWIIGHNDGHAKNYSLTHLPGLSVLSPFYDLNSALPFMQPGQVRTTDPALFDVVELALSVKGAHTLGAFGVESIERLETDAQVPAGELRQWALLVAENLQMVTNAVIAGLPRRLQEIEAVVLYPYATFAQTKRVKQTLGE